MMMEETMKWAHEVTWNQDGGISIVNEPIENEDSNDDDTNVKIGEEPTFRYDLNDDDDEVHKQENDEYF